VTVKVDDTMIKHYCNEDTFLIEIDQAVDDPSCCTITLVELEEHHRGHPHDDESNGSPIMQQLTNNQ
jgi:hypothetical protein